jgi:hypothetical protein
MNDLQTTRAYQSYVLSGTFFLNECLILKMSPVISGGDVDDLGSGLKRVYLESVYKQ